MTDLLHFPDDETKAFRRARAEALARAARDARIVASWVELLDDLTAAKPDGQGATPALDLARWLTDVAALLNDIKREPAHIRMEAGVTGRCLKLKGLVDEAEFQGFIEVTACEPPFLDAEGASRLSPGQAASGARRAPGAPASLTSGLLVRDPHSGGPSSSPAGSAAGPVPSPQETGTGSAVAGTFCGRAVADLRAATLLVRAFFHAVKMRLRGIFVTEKRNGHFSGGKPGGRA